MCSYICFNLAAKGEFTDNVIMNIAEVVVPELTVHWQESYYSASEADGSVEVCAELSTLQFTGSVEVNYATVADSAAGYLPQLIIVIFEFYDFIMYISCAYGLFSTHYVKKLGGFYSY